MKALLEALASAEFRVREDGTRLLMELVDEEPDLRSAFAASKDAEVRRRLRRILDVLAQKRRERTLVTMKADSNNGRADPLRGASRPLGWG